VNRRFGYLLCLLAVTVCVSSLPAAGQIFSDLGPPGNVYDVTNGYTIAGSGTMGLLGYTLANLFTAGGSGSESITQIDLAVGYISNGPFYASLWTNNNGLPGAQIANAYWGNLMSNTPFGTCCGLVTISGISGVNLTGGQQYFLVAGPMNPSDSSIELLNFNNQGLKGTHELYSNDLGKTWNNNGFGPVGAFDILGGSTPIPDVSGYISLQGAPLAGAGVSLYQPGENLKLTETDNNGYYQFLNIAAGKTFNVMIHGPAKHDSGAPASADAASADKIGEHPLR